MDMSELNELRLAVRLAETTLKGTWKEAAEAVMLATLGMLVALVFVTILLTLTMFLFHSPLNFPTLRAWLYDATVPGVVLFPPGWGIGVFTAKWRLRYQTLRGARYQLEQYYRHGPKFPLPSDPT